MRKINYLVFAAAISILGACKHEDNDDNYKMDAAKFMQQAASSGKFEVSKFPAELWQDQRLLIRK
jgi:hypothetical protein